MCDCAAKRRLEAFLANKELPSYNDLENVLDSSTKCLFCRIRYEKPQKIHCPELNVTYNICNQCQEYWLDISGGSNSGHVYAPFTKDETITVYFYKNKHTSGWVYDLSFRDNPDGSLKFKDPGNTNMYSSRVVALVAGLNHIFELNTLDSEIFNKDDS